MSNYFLVKSRGLGTISQLLGPRKLFLGTQKILCSKLNMLRCQSHQ